MTVRFVDNSATFVTGLTEADAYTTLGAAITAAAAGDIIRVRNTHTETANAAITYALPTTPGLQVLSVTFNGSGTGAQTAGATVNLGASSNIFTIQRFGYFWGMTFVGGTNNNGACTIRLGSGAAYYQIYDNCTIKDASPSAGTRIYFGDFGSALGNDSGLVFINSVFDPNGKTLVLNKGRNTFMGCSLTGTAPTSLFSSQGSNGISGQVLMVGCDWSGLAWTNLFAVANAAVISITALQCKLRSGFTIATGTFTSLGGWEVVLVDCDSGDNHYKFVKQNSAGTITTDNTKYANATNGTDTFSFLMASSAAASFAGPLVSSDIIWFNSTLSATTTTVPVAHNAVGGGTGGKLLNSDMWQETLAKISSGFTLGTWNYGDRVADITTTGADQDTDGTTSWTGSSIATHDKLVSGSFTPAEVGDIVVRVKLAKPSVSVYVSPLVLPNASKTWLGVNGSFINEQPASGGGTNIYMAGVIGG